MRWESPCGAARTRWSGQKDHRRIPARQNVMTPLGIDAARHVMKLLLRVVRDDPVASIRSFRAMVPRALARTSPSAPPCTTRPTCLPQTSAMSTPSTGRQRKNRVIPADLARLDASAVTAGWYVERTRGSSDSGYARDAQLFLEPLLLARSQHPSMLSPSYGTIPPSRERSLCRRRSGARNSVPHALRCHEQLVNRAVIDLASASPCSAATIRDQNMLQ